MLYNKADPGDAATELISIGFEHYRKFWQLREHFRKEDMQLFQLTAKAHHNCHACLLSAALNPRHRVSTQSLSSTFVPSLSLSISISLSLYIFIYLYIYTYVCVHNRFESSSSKKKLVFYVKVCLCLNCIRLVCLSRFVYTCIYVQTLSSPHVRLSWCYKWEDFMGVCRALAASCKKSGHGVAFCKRLLEKYTYLL